MKSKKYPLIVFFLICVGSSADAQQNLVYNHYYINPFLYNPSLIAPSGYTELFLNYRKQWAGFEGAPQTATMNLQLPLSYKAGLAVTGYQDEAGLIKTTTGLLSFSYQVYLGKRILDNHKIGFGISAGYTSSRIDSEDANDIQDPVYGNNTSSLDGQFGMHYQYNGFRLAFAIPRLFEGYVASENRFNAQGLTQIENTISSISYDFKLGPSVSLEPIFTYRTFEHLDDQFEALASLKFPNIGWVGGGYRQDYGAFALLGVNIKEKIRIGYAYEFATEQSDRVGNGTHEVQLIVRLGKKQFTRPQALGKAQPSQQPIQAQQPIEETRQVGEPDEIQEPQPVEEAKDQVPNEVTPETDVVQTQPVEPVEMQQRDREPVIAETEIKPEVIEPQVVKEEPPAVKKLNGQSLAPGHYVVVGAFRNLQNALDYTATLKRAGYPANVAFHEERSFYIVHMLNATTIEEARVQRDKYRQMSRYSFRDTWILSIE